MSFNTIAVIGLGYIGLPTASALAARGKNVIGIDVNQDVVDTINKGEIHIVEPELDMLVHAAVNQGYLKAQVKPDYADAYLIAVPTPFIDEHKPDLQYIKSAAESIATVLKKGDLVILESTSPVGTTEKISQWLENARPDLTFPHAHGENADINIAYCPERVLPGHILRELVQNDRVIGGLTPYCAERAASLYRLFVEGECVLTNSRTAEMCKLTENAFRDVNIAFANELSLICDKLNINVWELIKLANRHPRVGILQPGPGVGGHCIAVDPWFIVNSAPTESKLIRAAREINDAKPPYIIDQVVKLSENTDAPRIAFFGMTFKSNIDDFRESPSLEIVKEVSKRLQDVEILVVEPYAENLEMYLADLSNAKLVELDEALVKANILVMLVDHDVFRTVSVDKLVGKKIIDSRGCWTGIL